MQIRAFLHSKEGMQVETIWKSFTHMHLQEPGASSWSNGSYLFNSHEELLSYSYGAASRLLGNFLPFVRDSNSQTLILCTRRFSLQFGKERDKHPTFLQRFSILNPQLTAHETTLSWHSPKTMLRQPRTCWRRLGAGSGLHGLLRSLPALFSTPLWKEQQEMGSFSSTTWDLPSSGFCGAKVQCKAVIPLGNTQGARTRQTPSALSPWHCIFTGSGRCIRTSMWS